MMNDISDEKIDKNLLDAKSIVVAVAHCWISISSGW